MFTPEEVFYLFLSLFLDQIRVHGGSLPIYRLNASILALHLGGG